MDDGINRHLKKQVTEPSDGKTLVVTDSVHLHQFTIPVEWENMWSVDEQMRAANVYPNRTRVIRFRCPCGEETSR